MTIFRHRKMHVKIELEKIKIRNFNFVKQLVHVQINSLQDFKYEKYREGCFLEPLLSKFKQIPVIVIDGELEIVGYTLLSSK
jgi:hypothetical protein